uniref:Uncharacterized protein n=1 Tax=Ixodes ricinus TaxID=34613 RepID=A0A6B0UH60_IXORI
MNTQSLHRIGVFWNLIFCSLDIHIVVRGKPAFKHGVWHLNFVRLVWQVWCIQLATQAFFSFFFFFYIRQTLAAIARKNTIVMQSECTARVFSFRAAEAAK